MSTRVFANLLALLLLAEIVTCRSVPQYETASDGDDGERQFTWTSKNTISRTHVAPQSETIRITGGNIPTDELLKMTGIMKGMDPDAVTELLRTKQPVKKVITNEKGDIKTTTYKLQPDGTITSETVTEMKPIIIKSQSPSGFVSRDDFGEQVGKGPLEQFFNSRGSITRSYIDPDGQVVHTTVTRPYHHSPAKTGTNNFEFKTVPNVPGQETEDNVPWYFMPNREDWKPASSGHDTPTTPTQPTKVTKTFIDPFDNWPESQSETVPKSGIVKLPSSWDPHTWSGTRTIIQKSGPVFSSNPWEDPFNPKELDQPNFPSSHSFPSNESPQRPSAYPVKVPQTFEPEVKFHKPNLEDFFEDNYESTTRTPVIPSVLPNEKPYKEINIEDLPITEILNNGRPVDEEFLKTLPPEFRPTVSSQTTSKTTKIENIPRSDVVPNSRVETKKKTITKTFHTSNPPTTADLDPSMRDILEKAGISPEDIKSMQGDTIKKTRVEPDGKIITTTYRVRTSPSGPKPIEPAHEPVFIRPVKPPTIHKSASRAETHFPSSPELPTPPPILLSTPKSSSPTPHLIPRIGSSNNNNNEDNKIPRSKPSGTRATNTNTDTEVIPLQSGPSSQQGNEIDQFLAKIGLSANDILKSNGEIVKTIVDENGRVLTAKFVLSTIKGPQTASKNFRQPDPIK